MTEEDPMGVLLSRLFETKALVPLTWCVGGVVIPPFGGVMGIGLRILEGPMTELDPDDKSPELATCKVLYE